jgi:pimeloyl-ACP methyl ester carboxylesterase
MKTRLAWVAAWLFLLAVAIGAEARPAAAQVEAPPVEPETPYSIVYDEETDLTHIRIPTQDGYFLWSDVLQALADVRGFDRQVIADLLPRGEMDIDGVGTAFALSGINLAFGKGVRFSVARPQNESPALQITLDRVALLSTERRFLARIKEGARRIFPNRPRTNFGLSFDDGWKDAPLDKPLVVLVHGWQSTPQRWNGVLKEIRALGFPCGLLRYPNDGPIAESGQLLATELKKVARDQPQRKVTIISHSMGGLVARAAIEDPRWNPGNVAQLIMVAPPSHGSLLAEFGFGTDLFEMALPGEDRTVLTRFYASIEDGLCEASRDLAPGSLFLKELNARQRNDQVKYSILLGTGGLMKPEDLERTRAELQAQGESNRFVRFFEKKLDAMLADMDEVVEGKGDGVVALKRGRLEGVADTVVLNFRHNTILFEIADDPAAKALQQEVLARLK